MTFYTMSYAMLYTPRSHITILSYQIQMLITKLAMHYLKLDETYVSVNANEYSHRCFYYYFY